MKYRPISLLGIILYSLILIGGCSTDKFEKTIEPPNIIWLVAEDIGPALGCYGDSLAHTPNIDRLARHGLVFDRAYATAPICAPSRSCLMSGLYATSLGTQHLRCEIPFPEELKTLPEYLTEVGYFTSNRNKTDYNFDPEGRWKHWSGSYAPWRHRKGDEPFFSFINVGPTHEGPANIEERYLQSIQDLNEEELIDPQRITPPPYYPDLPETRELWARYYHLIAAMDKNVGRVLDSLETDGLMENTLIFFFGDHGFGMPRYKRWLYHTGLHVPLVVYAPNKYAHLLPEEPNTHRQDLVSFVDYVPTVLSLAGAELPPHLEGQVFLGPDRAQSRSHVFAARDRADDMFEMSRAIIDEQFIYIRHFMPHLPYIQSGFINSDRKDSYRLLRAAHKQGITNEEQEKLWNPKPQEELYDLLNDPQELSNLALYPDFQGIKSKLKGQLLHTLTEQKDLGLLTESEYMRRSNGRSPYTYARESDSFAVGEILSTAKLVGSKMEESMLNKLTHSDSGVRYWAAMSLRNFPGKLSDRAISLLENCLADPSPSVQILAAETLCSIGQPEKAINSLGNWVQSDDKRIALEAARTIQLVGESARPLIPILYGVLEKNLSEPGGTRKYKDFNYAAFTSWALEWALQELGEDIEVN